MFRRRHLKGVVCALVGAGLWGFSGACAQFLLANYDITPSFITAVRMLGAGAVFLLVLLVRNRAQLAAMLGDRRTLCQLAVFGGVGLFLCQITYTIVIGYTNACCKPPASPSSCCSPACSLDGCRGGAR